jgi:hypothetical protein
MSKTFKTIYVAILIPFLLLGCQHTIPSSNTNWWGLETGEEYLEVYMSDSIFYVCNANGTTKLKTIDKKHTSIVLVNFFDDTIVYSYKKLSSNHIMFFNNDYKVELYRMPVPVRTPFNTKNYFNDTIWEVEAAQGLMVRYQMFLYQKQNNLLEMHQ